MTLHLFIFISLSMYIFKFHEFRLIPLIPFYCWHNKVLSDRLPFLIYNFSLWYWNFWFCYISYTYYFFYPKVVFELPWWRSGKEPACQYRRCIFNPWVRKSLWGRKWPPTLVFLPGESHRERSLAVYSPWGHKTIGLNLATKQQSSF